MAKILKFDNRTIFADIAEEVAVLRVSALTPGSSVTLTLDNNDGLAENDYICFEDVASPRAEIVKINQAVTAGTQIRVDATKFPHNEGVKIYLLKYNQIKFYRAATAAGAKSELATKAIQVDQEYTEYVDSTNSTGYAFFTLFNSATSAESDYSSAFPYSLLQMATKAKIRELVKGFYSKTIPDAVFDMLLRNAEDEIFRIYPWRFRETKFEFNTTADQKRYTFSELGITDFGTMAFLTYDGNPIGFASFKENEVLNWGTIIANNPRVAYIWDNEIEFTPTPSEAVEVVMKYWKLAPDFSEETTETAVSMPQLLAFRILQDLWAMPDPKKAQYWEGRYQQGISLLRRSNDKQNVRFQTMTKSSMIKNNIADQTEYPGRIVAA